MWIHVIKIIGAFLLFSGKAWSISILVTGNWSGSLTSSDQAAGSFDFGSLEDTSSAVSLAISDTALLTSVTDRCGVSGLTWYVEAYVEDLPYGNGYQVEVKRNSVGVGTGYVATAGTPNGSNYQLLSTTPTILFCGEGNVSNIEMLYRISDFRISGGSGVNPSVIRYNVVGDL